LISIKNPVERGNVLIYYADRSLNIFVKRYLPQEAKPFEKEGSDIDRQLKNG